MTEEELEKRLEELKAIPPSMPTGKHHVSFSEINDWSQCSYRHYLTNVKKLGLFLPGPQLDFGTAAHAACEHFINTRVMDKEIAINMMATLWTERMAENIPGYTVDTLAKHIPLMEAVLDDVPAFMDSTFPNWKAISAEEQLYEQIGDKDVNFKGFIDAIIECDGKRLGSRIIYLIDFKTASWGWTREKVQDKMTQAQLVLYKKFWVQKHSRTDPKNIRCAFVLLKKAGKPGNLCQVITVSVGDVTVEKTMQIVNNMISSVKRGMALKKKGEACRWCAYRETEHCP